MLLTQLHQVELARRWKLSPRTLERWNAGTLERWRWLGPGPRHIKVGGRVVYRMEDVEAFEAENTRTSTSMLAGR